MGCLCSKEASEDTTFYQNERKEKSNQNNGVQLVAPKGEELVGGGYGSAPMEKKGKFAGRSKKTGNISGKGQMAMSQTTSLRQGVGGGDHESGWPSWLSSVAGDAIRGWVARRPDSYEKLDKIGQGTYSTVYRARDLKTGKFVAMKKVRFANMDPESVRFMAREINILRKLDHPNVMKLEALVTSSLSTNLYLVFEYMEHDLTGLASRPGVKFTEPQVKCFMKQLLSGLEHCHKRGILHRDIKGSNLLIDDNGVLKIGDFGLANFYDPNKKQALTSRVVTLWYRAPELLLGATDYGPAIDLWSAGCIIAELFTGKPIMPGRTEVEQMHKIFKLCGSPSEDYWRRTKLPLATSFKPQQPYKRHVADTFRDFPSSALALTDRLLSMEPENRGSASAALKSDFFTTEPFPCFPKDLPKYPPSKEFDAKLRNEEARRQRAESVRGGGPGGAESVRGVSKNIMGEFKIPGKGTNLKRGNTKLMEREKLGSTCRVDATHNNYPQAMSMVHPNATGASWRNNSNSTQRSRAVQSNGLKKDEKASGTGHIQKKIQYSGPLTSHGGNVDDMLKDHERQIQQAARKARDEKKSR